MTSRQRKALLTYITRKFVPTDDGGYIVQSRRSKKTGLRDRYFIGPDDETGAMGCSCPAFKEVFECGHLTALAKWLEKGDAPGPYEHLDPSKRARYPQDVGYKMARRVMMRAAPLVIRALADRVFPVTGAREIGRPRIEMRDLIMAISLRPLHDKGGDLAHALVEDAYDKGLLYRRPVGARPPSVEVITASMRSERTAIAFTQMIEASNAPYRGNVADIAIDGSEFNIPTARIRYAKVKKRLDEAAEPDPAPIVTDDDVTVEPDAAEEESAEDDAKTTTQKRLAKAMVKTIRQQTTKLNLAVDTSNGFIVAATVTPGKTHDSLAAIPLVKIAQKVRFVREVAADKAYPTAEFIDFLDEARIKANIPIKSNNTEDGLLGAHVIRWKNRTDADKDSYGYRQIVEAAFSRLKRLMGENLKSRTFEAQTVELLCQCLIANVLWLIGAYIHGDIEIDWLDARCRKILDPVRESLKGHPRADLSPRYRDGLTDDDAKAA